MYLSTASVDHKWGGAYSLHPKTAQKTPCKRVRSHFQQSLDITRSQTVHAEMNITRQKVGLSFSIENILRDDFCHSRRTNTNVESRETFCGRMLADLAGLYMLLCAIWPHIYEISTKFTHKAQPGHVNIYF